MASSNPTATMEASSLQTTRRMLDELDALMERMLALPVNELEEPALVAPPPVGARALAAKLTLLEAPAEVETEVHEPAPLQPPHRLPELPPERPELPRPAVRDLPPPPPPQPIVHRVLPAVAPAPALDSIDMPVERSPAWLLPLRPVLWCNEFFDRQSEALGGTGYWLRGASGRMAVGLTGFVLIAASAGWLLKDWLGWTW